MVSDLNLANHLDMLMITEMLFEEIFEVLIILNLSHLIEVFLRSAFFFLFDLQCKNQYNKLEKTSQGFWLPQHF